MNLGYSNKSARYRGGATVRPIRKVGDVECDGLRFGGERVSSMSPTPLHEMSPIGAIRTHRILGTGTVGVIERFLFYLRELDERCLLLCDRLWGENFV
jgi:hypothetical protein